MRRLSYSPQLFLAIQNVDGTVGEAPGCQDESDEVGIWHEVILRVIEYEARGILFLGCIPYVAVNSADLAGPIEALELDGASEVGKADGPFDAGLLVDDRRSCFGAVAF